MSAAILEAVIDEVGKMVQADADVTEARAEFYALLGLLGDAKFDLEEAATALYAAAICAAFRQGFEAGIPWRVVRLWDGARLEERALKRRHSGKALCPVCQSEVMHDRSIHGRR